MLKRVAWLAFAAMVVVAVVRGIPANPGLWAEWGSEQANAVAAEFNKWFENINLGDYENIKIDDTGKWTIDGSTSSPAPAASETPAP